MNAQTSSADHSQDDAASSRKKERICWPCIIAALPPLLLTLFGVWYVSEALTRGRELSGGPVAAISKPAEPTNVEAEEDAAFEMLRLQEDLDAANKALASAEAKLAAGDAPQGGAASESLAAAEAEMVQLRQMLRDKVAENASNREALTKAQQDLKLNEIGLARAAGQLAEAEKRVETLLLGRAGDSDAATATADKDALAAAEKQLAELRTQLAASEDAAKQAAAETSTLKEELALRGKGLAEVSGQLADAQSQIAALQKAEQEASSALQEAAELKKEVAELKTIAITAGEKAKKREAALEDERDEALAKLATISKREEQLQTSLNDAQAALAAAKQGSSTLGEGPNAAGVIASLKTLPTAERAKLFSSFSADLFRSPDFRAWLASAEAASARAVLAEATNSEGSTQVTEAEKKLRETQAALSKAEERLESEAQLRMEAEIEAKRLTARLSSREARISDLERTSRDVVEQAEKDANKYAEELKKLSARIAAAEALTGDKPSGGDPSAAAALAQKTTRIIELEKALEAAPKPDDLAKLQKRVSEIEAEKEKAGLALKQELASRAAAKAALARLAAMSASPAPDSADAAKRLAQRDATIRKLTAALATAEAKSALSASVSPAPQPGKVTLPEIGETSLADAAKAVGELLQKKDVEARNLRAVNATLQARLAAAPTSDGASIRLELPGIGPVEPEKAPEEVAKLLAVRDRSLKAALSENVALKAKLASMERTTPVAAPPRPKATDGAAAAAVFPKWREAPLQKVGGVELNVLSDPIAFDSASADLTKEGRKAVRKLARQLLKSLKQAPKEQWRLVIEGHTDQRPIRTKEFASNWDLSSARAAAVAWELQKQGVPSSRLLAVGRAASTPIDARWTRSAFALNRRIELSLLRRGGDRSRAEEK